MSTIMKRFTKGIVLRGESTDVTENAEGSLFQNSADGRIKAYIEGAVRQVVTNSQSQVLTNKTINADNNSISNIANAQIKAGAAIDASKIADGSVSSTEFQYLSNVTSDIQTQINSKEPTITVLPVSKGGTNSSTALNNNRVVQSSGGAIVEAAAITASRALVSDTNGIPTHSATTSTEIGYVSGVTSSIQTQLDAKTDEVAGTLTNGSIITPAKLDVKQDTKANLTTYALTASNGQLCFATDSKEMFQIVDGLLKPVGSGGAADVDALVIQDFNNASLTDFTQTGLSLIETNPVNGQKSARLIHQPLVGSIQSFKQTISVPPKFRGVNMTASLTLRSSASEGNVTITFKDETNNVTYPSQSLSTGSQQIASLTTSNGSPTVSGFSNSNINSLRAGMSVTGSGIPTGTTVQSVNSTALTITLSANATASATVSLNFSDLPKTIQVGFVIPDNCASYSYTISALQEAGSPETYVDDVVLKNYWLGMANQGQSTISIDVPVVTEWASYTPTFQGFGTPSNIEFRWRQVGQNIEINGKFTAGTVTSDEARIGLPSGLISSGTDLIPSIRESGEATSSAGATGDYSVLIEPSVSYISFGYQTGSISGLLKSAANNLVSTGQVFSFITSIPCNGLSTKQTKSFVTTDLVPAKAVLGNTAIDIPNVTGWQGYTPTFQGFGTPTNIEFEWRQVGENVEIRGKFTNGTTTGVEARIGLPAGLTSAGTSIIPSIQLCGGFNVGGTSTLQYHSLIEPSVTYLTFGQQGTGSTGLTKKLGTDLGSSGTVNSFFASVPCSGLSATQEVVVSGTQSALVQEADSSLKINGANGFGSTNTSVRRFSSIVQSIGSAFTWVDSATLGSYIQINNDGVYSFTHFENTGTSSSEANIFISLNDPSGGGSVIGATSGTLSISRDTLNTASASNKYLSNSWSGYLSSGDKIYFGSFSPANLASSSGAGVTAVYQGSLSQLNVSSDQKATIPTSELRFEGASTRGSTDTAIVRFDTLAKLRGDAFTVVSTPELGTAITMNKAGRLSIGASLYSSGNMNLYLTKNQLTKNAVPTLSSEILAFNTANTVFSNISSIVDVVIGDIIRVSTNSNPTANTGNSLNLSFQEQSIQVSVSNTLPQFSESDSSVRLDTANGNGSTGIKIRRFSNVRDNIGTDITYNPNGDEAVNGASFRVNTNGIYSIHYTDGFTSAVNFGISKNASSLITSPQLLNSSELLALATTVGNTYSDEISWEGYLNAGDIIRPHVDSNTVSNKQIFTISKVGKPNVTGVNVTPFVNVPRDEVEVLHYTGHSSFSGANSIPSTTVKNTAKGILQLNTSNGRFVALKKCIINVAYSNLQSTAGFDSEIAVNDSVVSRTDLAVASGGGANSWTGELNVGDYVTFRPQGAPSTQYIGITATALSDQILTAPETFSTDTASLQYAGSSQYTMTTLANAPVGTFITYTCAINTVDTMTQTNAAAPTQTTADMNTNGIQITARAYNAASSSASPAVVAIQIGKGHKGVTITGFTGTAKSGAVVCVDTIVNGTTSLIGFLQKDYNPTTGILVLDAASVYNSSQTTHTFYTTSQSGGGSSSSLVNPYFVINASKSPALVGVPLVQPRIATLSDVKASGTNGGGIIGGTFNTRTLNTIIDRTGIITSLASNQFTLPAGEYYIEASAPAYEVNRHQLRLRNTTDGATLILGSSAYAQTASGQTTPSLLTGNIVLSSAKTLELQHYLQSSTGVANFGLAASSGESEVYAQVKITKVK